MVYTVKRHAGCGVVGPATVLCAKHISSTGPLLNKWARERDTADFCEAAAVLRTLSVASSAAPRTTGTPAGASDPAQEGLECEVQLPSGERIDVVICRTARRVLPPFSPPTPSQRRRSATGRTVRATRAHHAEAGGRFGDSRQYLVRRHAVRFVRIHGGGRRWDSRGGDCHKDGPCASGQPRIRLKMRTGWRASPRPRG